jgi:hypothetical protein
VAIIAIDRSNHKFFREIGKITKRFYKLRR